MSIVKRGMKLLNRFNDLDTDVTIEMNKSRERERDGMVGIVQNWRKKLEFTSRAEITRETFALKYIDM